MRIRKWARIVSLITLLSLTAPLLTGCWDRLEIEERAVVLGLAIDMASKKEAKKVTEVAHLKGTVPTPKKGLIRLTAQIAVPGRIPLGPTTGGGGSGKSEKPVWILSSVGYTLDDALAVLQQELADKIFLGHLRVIVVSEKIARRGLSDINDYLRRDPEVRRLAWMAVSKGRADTFMKAAPQLERVPTLYLLATLDHARQMGKYPNEFVGVFWSKVSSLGVDPILPVFTMKEKQNVEIDGLAYFRGNKMVGSTKPLQIGFYLALTNFKRAGYSGFTRFRGRSDLIMIRSTFRKTVTKISVDHGKPHVDLYVFLEQNVEENPHPSIPVNSESDLRKIGENNGKIVKKEAERFIKTLQKAHSDIIGFGEFFRAKKPGYWNRHVKTKKNWENIYANMSVDVHVKVLIRRVGMKAR